MCIYMRERPSVVSVCKCNSSNSMSFLVIKDPAKRTALIDEHVKSMETIRRRNMVNREMKLAIGEELQTLFHLMVSATKQAAEKTAEETCEEGIRGYRWSSESSTVTYHTTTVLTTTEGSHIWYTCNCGWAVYNGEQYSAYRRKYFEGK